MTDDSSSGNPVSSSDSPVGTEVTASPQSELASSGVQPSPSIPPDSNIVASTTPPANSPASQPVVSESVDTPVPPPSSVTPESPIVISTPSTSEPSVNTPPTQTGNLDESPSTVQNPEPQVITEPQNQPISDPNSPPDTPSGHISIVIDQPLIPSLQYPFYDTHPVTFDFGAIPATDELKAKYQTWGMVGHNGIDFDIPDGSPVLACDSGEVTQSGDNGGFGTSITLLHPWGTSLYGHLQESLVVVGDKVQKKQKIGLSGHSGNASGPHVHFGIEPLTPDTSNGYLGFINPNQYLNETTSTPILDTPLVTPVTNQDVVQPVQPPPPATPVVTPPASNPDVIPIVQPDQPIQPEPIVISPIETPSNKPTGDVPIVPLNPVSPQDPQVNIQQAVTDQIKTNSAKGNEAKKAKRNSHLQQIMEFAQKKQKIKNEDIRDLLHISQSTATEYLTDLVSRGMLKVEGKGRATTYIY
jgi:murein DD-endopeptidase MepM/ murein hydrolase activator NlpD